MSDDIKALVSKYNIECPKSLDYAQKILLVEDQQDQRIIIKHHLEKLGYRDILQCSDGLEGIEFYKKGSIGVTISSMESERISGIDFLRELRDAQDLHRSPFVLAILNPSREKIMLATETGVDEIIAKPYTLKDIVPKMSKAFRIFHNPANPEKLYEFAKVKFRDGDVDRARQIYADIAKIAVKSARPLVGLARCALMSKDYEKAFGYLKQAEERNPNFVHIYVERGQIYMAKDDIGEALPMYRKAIELSPLNPIRYEQLAEILFNHKRYQEAIEILEIANKHELSFGKLNHYLSQAYYAVKDYKNAIKQIKVALRGEPNNTTYLNQLGISYKEASEFQEATKVYNSIIKLDPENKPALHNKAVLLAANNQLDEAIKILGRIVTMDPSFTPSVAKKAELEKLLAEQGSKKDAS